MATAIMPLRAAFVLPRGPTASIMDRTVTSDPNHRTVYLPLAARTTSRRTSQRKTQRANTSHKQTPKKTKLKQQQRQLVEDASSLGEAIQRAQSIQEYLSLIDKFVWLPTDEDLAPHLRTQAIHHEKRRRWGSQLLEGLGNAALEMWERDPRGMISQLSPGGSLRDFWTDARLLRTISSVSLQFNGDSVERPDKEGVWVASALKGLHVLSSCISPIAPSEGDLEPWIDLHRRVSRLIQSADKLLSDERTAMKDTVEVRWAIRGLVARLRIANDFIDNTSIDGAVSVEKLEFSFPNINARTSKLPFDILPHSLSWQMYSSSEYNGYPTQPLISDLLQSIPFNFDTLTTRTGATVTERRGTAWLAQDNIGALAYSGKLMPPQVLPDSVSSVMREIEQRCEAHQRHTNASSKTVTMQDGSMVEIIWDDNTSNNLPFQELGQYIQNELMPIEFFDCALCNHYPDGDSACKFHTDPEHGSHWHRTTAVVSAGTSRKFAFRPIPDLSTWAEWDPMATKQSKEDAACAPAAAQLFPGDVVFMSGACNDLFHHAVYASPFDEAGAHNSRVSLVLKRALDRGGGKKGHSLAGEGRRARRNS